MAPSDLQQRIAERFDQLSPKQRQVAQFIADNEAITAFSSAGDLGKAVDVDAATVVRLAQSLGFSGYVELQETIRNRLPERLTFVQRVEQQRNEPLDQQHLLAKVFMNDIENLNQTMSRADDALVRQVVGVIERAEHVYVVGAGFSAATAVFLGHGLNSLGIRTTVCTEGGSPLAVMLANLRPTDVLVGVSVWRYLRDTVNALAHAAARGVPTLALTDSHVSAVARLADHSLVAATRGVGHNLSPVGLMSLVNLVLVELVARDPDRTLPPLREIDRLYREFGQIDRVAPGQEREDG